MNQGKLLIVVGLCFGLAACGGDVPQVVAVQKFNVPTVPSSYYNCPLTSLPQSFKSNAEVARSYIQLYHDNATCHNSIQAIQSYLNKAKSTIK